VQNALLNLRNERWLDHGDRLKAENVVRSVDTLKNAGYNRTASCCCRSGTTSPGTDLVSVTAAAQRCGRHGAGLTRRRKLSDCRNASREPPVWRVCMP